MIEIWIKKFPCKRSLVIQINQLLAIYQSVHIAYFDSISYGACSEACKNLFSTCWVFSISLWKRKISDSTLDN